MANNRKILTDSSPEKKDGRPIISQQPLRVGPSGFTAATAYSLPSKKPEGPPSGRCGYDMVCSPGAGATDLGFLSVGYAASPHLARRCREFMHRVGQLPCKPASPPPQARFPSPMCKIKRITHGVGTGRSVLRRGNVLLLACQLCVAHSPKNNAPLLPARCMARLPLPTSDFGGASIALSKFVQVQRTEWFGSRIVIHPFEVTQCDISSVVTRLRLSSY